MQLTRNQQRAVIAEFLGTLFFVFCGTGAVVAALDGSPLVAIAMAHGLAILIAAAWTGGISGGHINPAVTLAMFIAKKVTAPVAIAYVIAQFAGAVAGSALLKLVTTSDAEGSLGAHALGNGVAPIEGLGLEIILTAFLVLVIFNTAVSKKGWGANGPIAIGFAVMLIHLVAVPWTGASVNPARSFGPALIAGEWDDFWIYILGPAIGATIVALFWKWWKSFGDPLEDPAPAAA